MSSPIPEEISDEILKQIVPGLMGGGSMTMPGEPLTVAELREFLKPLGPDITTTEAVDWSVVYPGSEGAKAKIIELEAQLAEALSKKLP